MNLKTLSLAFALLGAVASASAVELVTNGDFQAQDADGVYGAGWNIDANFDYSGDRSYFFDEWGDIDGYFAGASASLSYYNGDDVAISQSIQTTGYSNAKLSFNFYSDAGDPAGIGDTFTVKFGGVTIDTFDVGADTDYAITKTYDLSAYFTGGLKTLELRGTNVDDGTNVGVGTYVDKVSLTATPVPEPASMAALGLGGAAMFRRRRRAR